MHKKGEGEEKNEEKRIRFSLNEFRSSRSIIRKSWRNKFISLLVGKVNISLYLSFAKAYANFSFIFE